MAHVCGKSGEHPAEIGPVLYPGGDAMDGEGCSKVLQSGLIDGFIETKDPGLFSKPPEVSDDGSCRQGAIAKCLAASWRGVS